MCDDSVKGISEKIMKILRKFDVKTIHKPTKKLKNYVCNMKERIHPLDRVGAVYEVEVLNTMKIIMEKQIVH